MDLKQIQDLIEFVAQSGVSEVNLEKDDIKLTIKTQQESEQDSSAGPSSVYAQMLPPQMMAAQQPMAQPMPQQQQPAAPGPPTAEAPADKPAEPASEEIDESKYVPITSPMIGTFYRSPSPDKEPFVKVGDKVESGQPVCVVEAMKLFNEIESEVSGKVVKIEVENAAPVEYDQTLFLVDPNG
jgi:acetyl-CoA carboxylase biotin carboxyl carrier protein